MKKFLRFSPNRNLFLKRQLALAIVLALVNMSFRVGWEPKVADIGNIEPETYDDIPGFKYIPPVPIEKEVEEAPKARTVNSAIVEIVPDEDPIDNVVDEPFDPTSIIKPDIGDKKQEERQRIVLESRSADYPGGMEAFVKFLKDNLEYPEDAAEDEMECNLDVRFTINEFGKVVNIEILEIDVQYYGFEGMVYEVLERMPAWNPAIKSNSFVSEEIIIAVSFFLEY